MSKVLEILESSEPLKESIQFKVNTRTYTLLNQVLQYRIEKGLSRDFSDLMRQIVKVSLLCDDPENYMPKFDIPKMESLMEPQSEEETELTNLENVNHE